MGQKESRQIQPATIPKGWAKVETDDDYMAMGLYFNVPLDHQEADPGPSRKTITVHASLVYEKKYPGNSQDSKLSTDPATVWKNYKRSRPWTKPFLVYLCGGPGDGNGFKRVPGVTKFGIERGYQILFLDYRGTGESEAFPSSQNTDPDPSPNELADYLSHFTQSNIVQDLEAVRLWFDYHLNTRIKFTLLAQSFGGWIAITYLSRLPTSLKAVLLTAAMPPFTKSPTDVYKALYRRVMERNDEFYKRYPDDAARLLKIVTHLHDNPYPVSGGRFLTSQTIMSLGRTFGGSGGFGRVHDFMAQAAADLDDQKSIKPETLAMFADKSLESFRLHQRPLYGLLHEAIYCCHARGVTSNWAAQSVGREIGGLAKTAQGNNRGHEQSLQLYPSPKRRKHKQHQSRAAATSQATGCFSWLDPTFDPSSLPQTSKLYFSGEMIFPFMFDFHCGNGSKFGLDALGFAPGIIQKVAEILATKSDWPQVYDIESLKKNAQNIPVRALVYKGDMYIDWEVSVEMGTKIGGPCEVILVGPKGDIQLAVSHKAPGPETKTLGSDSDLEGEWEWSHGAVKATGKTEKVLKLLFEGDCW